MVVLAMALLVASCDSGVSPDPTTEAPTILIEGVEDGGRYSGSVTLQISVEDASWEAHLNGERIGSVHTVETPGEYDLMVLAQAGVQETREEVSFEVVLEGESQLIVRMIDLGDNPIGGGGDAVLLTDSSAAGMMHVLVDAGTGPDGGNNGNTSWVSHRLQELGVDTLHTLLMTHAHADHYLGMRAVLRDVHVRRFVYNGQVRSNLTYRELMDDAVARADSIIVIDSLREYQLGFGVDAGSRVVIIPPLPTFLGQDTNDGSELNEGSLGMRVERGDFSLFLTGDGEYEANRRWRVDFGDYSAAVDVLKIGHHGANNAIFDSGFGGPATWIAHTDPAVALITANGRTHPRVAAVSLLRAQEGLAIYCTHVHGTVEVRVSPAGNYFVKPARNARAACTAGSEATT